MFVDAWNHRDPDALAALFDTDAEFVNVTGLWRHTRDEIRSAHAYGLIRIFKDSWLQATDVRVKRLSDEIAVLHARMTLTGQTSVDEITAPRPRSNVMSLSSIRRRPAGASRRPTMPTSYREVKRTSLMIRAGCGRSAIATCTDSNGLFERSQDRPLDTYRDASRRTRRSAAQNCVETV